MKRHVAAVMKRRGRADSAVLVAGAKAAELLGAFLDAIAGLTTLAQALLPVQPNGGVDLDPQYS